MTTTVMRASAAQRSRTKTEEGLRLTAYADTVGIYTIGWGHASVNPTPVRGLLNGGYYEGKVCKGLIITTAEAERLYELDVDEIERGASALITADMSQPQFDGVVDFCFQYGVEKFRNSELLVKINFNPNSPSVFDQFMRWTRAGGEHQEYVWRRSARRCCVYNGTPIPQALWRKGGFPFAITKDDKVDYSITPTIDKIIAYGKKAAEPFKFDPAKISLEPQAPAPTLEAVIDTIPVQLPVPDPIEDELFLDTPAEPEGTSDAKGSPPVPPQPVPAAVPSSNPAPSVVSGPGAGPAAAEKVAPRPSAPPVLVPAPAPPKSPPVIAPKSIDIKAIPYGEIDAANGAKNMTDSQRGIGLAIVAIGSVVQILAGREIVSSTVGAVFFDMSRDPAIVAIIAGSVVMLIGWATRKRGTKVMTDGMRNATQVLK